MKGYNHGVLISEETRKKMSEASKRTRNGFKKGHEVYLTNHSEETKKRMSEYAKSIGRKPVRPADWKPTKEHREKLSLLYKGVKVGRSWNLGKTTPLEVRIKISNSSKGEKGNNWQGGKTGVNMIIRRSLETREWREAVFLRDDYTCQKTGIRGCKLRCHHILNFAQHPELRLSIDNGITLSKESHELFHRTYGVKNNTREQMEEFLGRKLV